MAEENWADIGSTEDLSRAPLQHVTAGNRELAVSFKDGRFGVVCYFYDLSERQRFEGQLRAQGEELARGHPSARQITRLRKNELRPR